MNNPLKIIVIGGGAAGFFGAIRAAECNSSAEIIILESTHQPLDKVRISGGGRCNVTHHCFDPTELIKGYPRGSRELRGAFSRFQASDTVDWFSAHGIELKTESDGRMFPITDSSATIVDGLLETARAARIELRLGSRVTMVDRHPDGGFHIHLNNDEPIDADAVLLASGSAAIGHQITEALGHSIVPCVPSLFTFKIMDNRLADLAGISVAQAELGLLVNGKSFEQSGPLLITHWGLSGPAVLRLSAWAARELHDAHYRATLIVNWMPSHSEERLRKAIDRHRTASGTRTVQSHNPDLIPRRLWERLCGHACISETTIWAQLTKTQLDALISELRNGQFLVSGKGQFKEEFVTCGGVSLKEIDFRTMESRICPGLFMAGEILDIDGITGGYNFQSAWTTGWIAGSHIASGLNGRNE